MSQNNVVVRHPPRFPQQCLSKARSVEVVAINFDVSKDGVTEEIESVFSTNSCLTRAAEKSVEKWGYAPRIVNGEAYPRKNVYTEVTFELSDNLNDSIRRKITQALTSISVALDRKTEPRITLEKIALVEKMYGYELREVERAILLRYRGSAKIDALDYQGALVDLQASLALEKDKAIANSLKNVISQLETALASASAAK